MSLHSQQWFSVHVFHIILGLPVPCLQSTCLSHVVLSTPLECSTSPNQGRLLSLKMWSRSLSSSFNSISLDLTVATSPGLILDMCLIMALLLCSKFGLVNCQVSLEHGTLHARPHLKERWWDSRTGSSSLNFFHLNSDHQAQTPSVDTFKN